MKTYWDTSAAINAALSSEVFRRLGAGEHAASLHLLAELRTNQTELATRRGELARLRRAGSDPAELERLREWQAQNQPELNRLRGMAGVARRAMAENAQLRAELARQAAESAANSAGGLMADTMKKAMEQQFEGRLSRMTASLRLTLET